MLGNLSAEFKSEEVIQGVSIKRKVANLSPERNKKYLLYMDGKSANLDGLLLVCNLEGVEEFEAQDRKFLRESKPTIAKPNKVLRSFVNLGTMLAQGTIRKALFYRAQAKAHLIRPGMSPLRKLKGCLQSFSTRILVFSGVILPRTSPEEISGLGSESQGIALGLIRGFWDFYPVILDIKPDLIHAHELSALYPAVIAAKKLNVPVIYDSHELEFARNFMWGDESFNLWRAHERALVHEVDAVIAVSKGCADALRREYGLERVEIVRNCPSIVRRTPARTLRDVVRLDIETPLIVFVGKVTFNRGLETVVGALSFLPRFHLVCVGPEDSHARFRIDQLIEESGCGKRVHFVPAVAPDELIEFISGADVSVAAVRDVCLSYRYCLPNKLFESAHAGLPVVVSDLPDMRSFVEEWDIGEVVRHDDPSSWAAAIELTYEKREKYYCQEKLERIRLANSAESEALKLLDLYRRLLKNC